MSRKKDKQFTPKKKITLKDKLHSIYYGSINLDTTCKGRCECCKTACPSMNYSEFSQIINYLWKNISKSEKIEMICKSVEYFFKYEYEKFGKDIFIKPCMLLNDKGLCIIYSDRPLSCRLYGLWPKDTYKERVDKFEKAYSKFGLKREELPLNTQCPYVKRIDESISITSDLINDLYKQLDNLDAKVGEFTELQIKQKNNYRTFHDWLLFKTFGEEWLSNLTTFILAADKNIIEQQIIALKNVIRQKFAKEMPNI